MIIFLLAVTSFEVKMVNLVWMSYDLSHPVALSPVINWQMALYPKLLAVVAVLMLPFFLVDARIPWKSMPRQSFRVGNPKLMRMSTFWRTLDGWNSISAYSMECDLKTWAGNFIRVGMKWIKSKYFVYFMISMSVERKCSVDEKVIVSIRLAWCTPFLSSFKKPTIASSSDEALSMLRKLKNHESTFQWINTNLIQILIQIIEAFFGSLTCLRYLASPNRCHRIQNNPVFPQHIQWSRLPIHHHWWNRDNFKKNLQLLLITISESSLL